MNLQSEYSIFKIHHFHLSLFYPDVLIYQMIKVLLLRLNTVRNMKLSVNVSFSTCEQTFRKMGIRSYLLKQTLKEGITFMQ